MSEDYLSDPNIGLRLIPEQASRHAEGVDMLYFALLGFSALLVTVLVGLVVTFGFRYRAGKTFRRRVTASHVGHRVEVGFALSLGVVFMALFAWAGKLYLNVYANTPAQATLNVVAKQWMWKVQHPDGTREINTLHVPANQSVRLRITSQDVIHSFSVPALRLKRDAVPGLYTSVTFVADKPGEYRLFCAEYCGTDHSRMRGKMVVMAPSDYQNWLTRNGTGTTPAAAGKALFRSYGCSGCHMGESSVRAPSLDGVYGRSVALANGGIIIADEAYLRDSIMRPQKHIVAGYQPVMPSFSGQISESDVLQIIAYLQSLKPGDWRTEAP
ncbi:cytochrome c oxidase subunit II [Marinimicrobium locisalis]|uniref:cytochrome c oxidase subunit II n=1 Tax=Marinimicrobium locisalis TaxID=546022 RepID=UPI003221AEA1